ncbi:MAG: 4-phosphopantetheinyl transferase family protein [Quinella sp. 3Q1]|nr:4-phosphopantetheinyl transferase family protein [Quinella sp. 3Q1]MBR6887470.1 4-phosphopantetheinyl transferase family protein [Selenomonadaceae bacterium]
MRNEYEKIISLIEKFRRRQFLIYWTLKESHFKLTGAENFMQADCEKILRGCW